MSSTSQRPLTSSVPATTIRRLLFHPHLLIRLTHTSPTKLATSNLPPLTQPTRLLSALHPRLDMSNAALVKRYTKLLTKLQQWQPATEHDPLIEQHQQLLSQQHSLPQPTALTEADATAVEDWLKRVEGFSRQSQIAQGLGRAEGEAAPPAEKKEKKEKAHPKQSNQQPKQPKEKVASHEEEKEQPKPSSADTVEQPLPQFIAHRLAVWDRIASRQQPTPPAATAQPQPITITLPDGRQLEGVAGVTTPFDIAKQLTNNADKFVIAKLDDTPWDLYRPIDRSCRLVLCDFDSKDGSHTFWHSSAHLLGQAVEREYKDVNLCIGPALDDGGFYYDVEMGEQKVTPADFKQIERTVEKIVKEKQPFQRLVLSKEEALDMFRYNKFKQEIIQSKVPDGENCTAYRCGPLIDLCIAAGTKVNLANGTSVAIENVRPGDAVLSLAADGGLEPRVVTACSPARKKDCVELLFADGRTLVCTADHRIRAADDRWVTAGELQLGDAVAVSVEYPSHDLLASTTMKDWQLEQFFSARRLGEKYAAGAVENVDVGAVKKQKMANNKVIYGVHRSSASLPLFCVQLIAKRDVGKRVVYDLAVPSGNDDLDSFTAAGVVVHNCKGPHVPHSGYIKAVSVTKSSSSYWLAKAENPSLQRVYGISFPNKSKLKEWEEWQRNAEERDHRRVGVQQKLFFFHEWSPGSCFFLPHGTRIYNKLCNYIRSEYVKRGYSEVISPNVFNIELWKKSGHYENYKENMFLFECEHVEFGMKPMNVSSVHNQQPPPPHCCSSSRPLTV